MKRTASTHTYHVEGVRLPQHFPDLHVSLQVNASIHNHLANFNVSRHGVEVLDDGAIAHGEVDTVFLKPTTNSAGVFSQ